MGNRSSLVERSAGVVNKSRAAGDGLLLPEALEIRSAAVVSKHCVVKICGQGNIHLSIHINLSRYNLAA